MDQSDAAKRKQIQTAVNNLPKSMTGEEMSALLATITHAYGLRADDVWPMAYEAWHVLKQLEVPNDATIN